MTKTRSKIKFVLIAFLLAIGLFLTFASFVIPTTNTTYRGFFGAINYGYDIAGGRLSVYEVSESNSDEAKINMSVKIDNIVGAYQSRFADRGLTVTRQGDNIRITVSNYDNDSLASIMSRSGYGTDLFEMIGSEKGIVFSSAESFDSVGADDIDGSYIKDCVVGASQASGDGTVYYPITINFSEEGQTKFKEFTQGLLNDGKKLYMYVNGTSYISGGLEVTNAVSSLTLTTTSQNGATALQLQISALAKPLILSKIVDDSVSSGLNMSTGAFLGNVSTMLVVALLAILVATIIFLCIKYRILGLFASLSLLVFICVYSFMLQSINLVLIDINGLMGVLATYIILVAGMIDIFERIREEYRLGKKIPNSVQSGFKRNVLRILEKYVFLLVVCMIVFIVGTPALKHLSIALFVGLLVNYFTLFVALRGMCNTYLPINSTKKSLYNLKREVAKDEI